MIIKYSIQLTFKEVNSMKEKTNRNYKRFTSSFLSLLLISSVVADSAFAATKQLNFSFPANSSEQQSKTFPLPTDFDSVSSISSDTGNASYDVNNGNLIVTVNNGNPTSSSTVFNPYKYSKLGTLLKYSTTNNFPATETYADAEGYNGILNKIGTSYVISGTLTPGESKTTTDSVIVSDTNDLATTLDYNDGYFTGTLNKSGAPVLSVIGGSYIQQDNKIASSSSTSSSNSFSSSITYDDGSYRGTLYKDGSSTSRVVSGSYTPSDTKFVTNQTSSFYNSGGYSGSLSSYLYSGSYTSSTSKYVTGSSGSYTWGGHCVNGTTGETAYKSKPSKPSTEYYSSGGYSGTLSLYTYSGTHPDPVATCGINTTKLYRYAENYQYKGTVTKPAIDTRIYRYEGNVTKPAYDTRVYEYEQNYSGTVVRYKNISDTVVQPTSTGFPSSTSYSDEDGYIGTLVKNGSPVSVLKSGSYTPSDSKTQSTSQTNSTNSFPSSISYSSGGYSGTLNKSGASSSTVISGSYSPSDSKPVNNSYSGS